MSQPPQQDASSPRPGRQRAGGSAARAAPDTQSELSALAADPIEESSQPGSGAARVAPAPARSPAPCGLPASSPAAAHRKPTALASREIGTAGAAAAGASPGPQRRSTSVGGAQDLGPEGGRAPAHAAAGTSDGLGTAEAAQQYGLSSPHASGGSEERGGGSGGSDGSRAGSHGGPAVSAAAAAATGLLQVQLAGFARLAMGQGSIWGKRWQNDLKDFRHYDSISKLSVWCVLPAERQESVSHLYIDASELTVDRAGCFSGGGRQRGRGASHAGDP